MALALIVALSLLAADPAADGARDPAAGSAPAAAGPASAPTREQMEDALPEGAPADDYEFVAWCHGALAGQTELDPIVEKDMDAIEGKEEAAKRKADDAAIAGQHKAYLKLYEQALSAAEKASPSAIHPKGVAAELQGYRIWGATRNKAPIWRMVDWGNWEVPPRCQKAARRLFDRATLFGAALNNEPGAAPRDPGKDAAPPLSPSPGTPKTPAPPAGAAPPT